MKKTKIFLTLVLSMFILMFGKTDIQAETILENHYTNPYYEEVQISSASDNDIDTCSLDSKNTEYTSDLEKISEDFRTGLVNRESEITLYYHCEETITNEYFQSLTNQLFNSAVEHTGNGNEGDYILEHCQGWKVQASWRGNEAGGYDMTIAYTLSYLSNANQEEQVDQKIAEVLQSLDLEDKTDDQKVKAIYDYICSNVSYDYDNLNDDTYIQKYTAYAALIDKTAVCQGYASLFYRMALDAGVDSRVITGDAGGPHAWNIVELEDKYYNLDSTWDAGKSNYSYFLKSLKAFSDHERDDAYKTSSFMEAYPMSENDYQTKEENEEDYEYRITDDNEVVITKYTGNEENVTTPTMLEGKPVVGIGQNAFAENDKLKVLTISEGVRFFEGTIVDYNLNLKEINLPSTLSLGKVEGNAYSGCNGVSGYCPELEKITVAEDNPYLCEENGIIYTKDKTVVICCAPKTELGDLVLPSSVTYICDSAFNHNNTLTSVQIADQVTYIGYWAFNNCTSLQKVYIPKSVTSIKDNVFANVESITDVYYAGTQKEWEALEKGNSFDKIDPVYHYEYDICEEIGHHYVDGSCTNCGKAEGIIKQGSCGENLTWTLNDAGLLKISGTGKMKNYSSSKSVPWYEYIDQIKQVVIEKGITSIGNFAFYGLTGITEISLPKGMEIIGDYAFKGCTALEKAELPKNLWKIGESAFYGCVSLKEMNMPDTITVMGAYAFKGCTGMEKLHISTGLVGLNEAAFYGCSSLKEITIPDSIKRIDGYVFKNCSGVTEVKLSENLVKLGESAFYGCSSLVTLEIPKGVTVIGGYTFKNCTSLQTVTLPSDLERIGEAAFYGCTSLEKIEIPDKVTRIDSYAFKNCVALKEVKLPAALNKISESCFYGCTSLETLVIPENVTEIGAYAFRKCSGLKNVEFSTKLTKIGESAFYGCESITSLTLPENVVEIGAYAFKGCTGIVEISLPDSLETIHESAFYGCTGLKKLTIPSNVKTIGAYAFSRCTSLTDVEFKGNAPTIGENAFAKVNAEMRYPSGNDTWTDSIMKQYGGTLKWVKM